MRCGVFSESIMISVYFGLPGCGKTTTASMIALRSVGKYEHVYGNVHFAIPGYTYIDNDCIGKYDLSSSHIIIDEATLYADSRDFKMFKGDRLQFWMQYRHYKIDISLFVQKWDALDIKIRNLTDRVFWIKSGKILPISKIIRIPFGIGFESDKLHQMSSQGHGLMSFASRKKQLFGDIMMGYKRPKALTTLFCPRVIRPLYYKYFDSWEAPLMPPLPDKYQPYGLIAKEDEQIPSVFQGNANQLAMYIAEGMKQSEDDESEYN